MCNSLGKVSAKIAGEARVASPKDSPYAEDRCFLKCVFSIRNAGLYPSPNVYDYIGIYKVLVQYLLG